mmetsp:Transcript_48006/g.104493  ORF Transcript_48006/g.104493 Transcript_48006/m.104493 type:complete len:204 (-) Transcript_48006:963-1574(-)
MPSAVIPTRPSPMVRKRSDIGMYAHSAEESCAEASPLKRGMHCSISEPLAQATRSFHIAFASFRTSGSSGLTAPSKPLGKIAAIANLHLTAQRLAGLPVLASFRIASRGSGPESLDAERAERLRLRLRAAPGPGPSSHLLRRGCGPGPLEEASSQTLPRSCSKNPLHSPSSGKASKICDQLPRTQSLLLFASAIKARFKRPRN